MRGTATHSTIDNLRELVKEHRGSDDERRLVLFVDYLQKVPVIPEPNTEEEKVTRIVSGLKDIALGEMVPVVAIVAADREGLKAKRLRNHHLRGSSAINYESDIILILNDKYNIVAKVNIEFNPYQAQRYRDWVIASIEKNRGGPGQRRPRVREALRVQLLRPDRPDHGREAHRGTPLQRLRVPEPMPTGQPDLRPVRRAPGPAERRAGGRERRLQGARPEVPPGPRRDAPRGREDGRAEPRLRRPPRRAYRAPPTTARRRAAVAGISVASTARSGAVPPPSSPSPGSVLAFGRYAGWSLRDLARRDPDYLLWLSRHSSGIRYRTEIYGILRTMGVSAA